MHRERGTRVRWPLSEQTVPVVTFCPGTVLAEQLLGRHPVLGTSQSWLENADVSVGIFYERHTDSLPYPLDFLKVYFLFTYVYICVSVCVHAALCKKSMHS